MVHVARGARPPPSANSTTGSRSPARPRRTAGPSFMWFSPCPACRRGPCVVIGHRHARLGRRSRADAADEDHRPGVRAISSSRLAAAASCAGRTAAAPYSTKAALVEQVGEGSPGRCAGLWLVGVAATALPAAPRRGPISWRSRHGAEVRPARPAGAAPVRPRGALTVSPSPRGDRQEAAGPPRTASPTATASSPITARRLREQPHAPSSSPPTPRSAAPAATGSSLPPLIATITPANGASDA